MATARRAAPIAAAADVDGPAPARSHVARASFRRCSGVETMSATTSKLIKGATGDWEVVIGMEVHAQVTSNSKLFSGASTEFGGEPNSHVSLVDAAMPGMLPVINEECVKQAVRTGLGLNARSICARCSTGRTISIRICRRAIRSASTSRRSSARARSSSNCRTARAVTVGIERLHLEQDAGKSLHDQHPTMSFVDLNRSGVALMEIVSKPDICVRPSRRKPMWQSCARSCAISAPATATWRRVRLRADVNVSVRKPGDRSAPAARSRT